jgi:hypothetical protein
MWKYTLDHNEINDRKIFSIMEERYQNTPSYCGLNVVDFAIIKKELCALGILDTDLGREFSDLKVINMKSLEKEVIEEVTSEEKEFWKALAIAGISAGTNYTDLICRVNLIVDAFNKRYN